MAKKVRVKEMGYGLDTRRTVRKDRLELYPAGSLGFVAQKLDSYTSIVELDCGLTLVISPDKYEVIE